MEDKGPESSVVFLCLTSVGQSGDDDAAASSGCDHEAGLDDGYDGETFRLRYHMSYNTDTKVPASLNKYEKIFISLLTC